MPLATGGNRLIHADRYQQGAKGRGFTATRRVVLDFQFDAPDLTGPRADIDRLDADDSNT